MMLAASQLHVPSALLGASLRAGRGSVHAVLAGVAGLANQHGAFELALAMVLAWLKRQDPAELGYSSFASFCRERLDWRGSWLRELVALVESPLDLVKRAAAAGLVPLRIAVGAPGRVSPEAQEAWLGAVVLAEPVEAPKRGLVRVEGEQAETVRRARDLARLCLGRAASAREVDDYILACWSDRVPAERILEDARRPPPPPDHGPPLTWSWYTPDAGVEGLVGAWAEPGDPAEAVARVDALQAVLRGRRIVLARAWALIVSDRLWADAGFPSVEACAHEVLGMSLRNAQRLARLGRTLLCHPEIDHAVRGGLPLGCAEALASVLREGPVADWIGVAERVGRLELTRALEDVRHDGGARTLRRYQWAIAAAERWDRESRAAEPGGGATSAGARGSEGAGAPDRPPMGGLRVGLRHRVRFSDAPTSAPPGLVEAARWFLETVRIPPKSGFAAVKDLDDHWCANPECGRRSLRNEAHHVHPRSEGGPDTLENGTCACRVCHLRGVHGGRLGLRHARVEGFRALLWTWPDGRRALVFQEEPCDA